MFFLKFYIYSWLKGGLESVVGVGEITLYEIKF